MSEKHFEKHKTKLQECIDRLVNETFVFVSVNLSRIIFLSCPRSLNLLSSFKSGSVN